MAEAIGLAASIIAVVQLAGAVTALGYNYIAGVSRAPKDLQDLVDELYSLGKVLSTLSNHLHTHTTLQTSFQALDGTLKRCTKDLEELRLKLEPRNGFKGVVDSLKWPLREKDTMQHIAQIERHKGLFMLALAADQMALSNAINTSVQEIGASVQGIDISVHKIEAYTESANTVASTENRAKILNWIYSEDFETRHIEIKSRRQDNTGDWIVRLPEFLDWRKGQQRSGSRLLWGCGIPGAGKTFLSSVVIDHLQAQLPKNHGLAYIYFDYREQERQKPIQVLSSLVKQLAGQVLPLPTEFEALYTRLQPGGKSPNFEDLYVVLLAASRKFSQVFLVFDALDECHPGNQRRVLLPLLQRMGKEGINIFMTSRPHPEDIQDRLSEAVKIDLSAQKEDITIYIENTIEENSRARRLVRQGKCKDRIISELVNCAQGMFLLVRFHVEFICQQTNPRQIIATLDKLKNTSNTGERPLDPTYDRAMASIRGQQRSSVDLALNVFSWLVKAKRILTFEELQVALAVEQDQYELDELNLNDRATLLDICAGLVVIDEQRNTVKLAHYTVQEYLLENSIIPTGADFRLSMVCITYLTFDVFAQGPCICHKSLKNNQHKPYCFFGYASRYLYDHFRACDEGLSTDMFLRFLEHPGNTNSYLSTQPWVLGYRECRKARSPLHMASWFGHLAAIQFLIDQGKEVDISAQDGEGWTALHLAALYGHEKAVCLLLENKADISIQNSRGETVLHLTAFHGSTTVVELLLERGADPSIRNNCGETALHLAVSGWGEPNTAVFRLLLESGMDTSVQDNYGETALHLAAFSGNTAAVSLLLESGVDASSRNNGGETALHHAASRAKTAIVDLLLESGVDILGRSNSGETALHHAVFSGDIVVISLLLERGADISSQSDDGRTPLHRAASSGNIAVVNFLLERGADISVQNNDGGTVLHCAASSGDMAVVDLLLKRGLDISVRDNHGETALHRAVSRRNTAVANLLIERGADISIQNRRGETALHLAISKGNKVVPNGDTAVVDLLLGNGVDITARNRRGETALHLAVSKCGDWNTAIVRQLLKRGADISARNDAGETALHRAAFVGNTSAISLLLENKADTSVQNRHGETALHLAASGWRKSNIAIARRLLTREADTPTENNDGESALDRASRAKIVVVGLLLESGADISIRNNDGETALHRAASRGEPTIVSLLLERGADTSIRNNHGETALHRASSRGKTVIVGLLLKRGANTSIENNHGGTALHCAVSSRNIEIATLLLESGADTSIQNERGETALHLASLEVYDAIHGLLVGRGEQARIIPKVAPEMMRKKHYSCRDL